MFLISEYVSSFSISLFMSSFWSSSYFCIFLQIFAIFLPNFSFCELCSYTNVITDLNPEVIMLSHHIILMPSRGSKNFWSLSFFKFTETCINKPIFNCWRHILFHILIELHKRNSPSTVHFSGISRLRKNDNITQSDWF